MTTCGRSDVSGVDGFSTACASGGGLRDTLRLPPVSTQGPEEGRGRKHLPLPVYLGGRTTSGPPSFCPSLVHDPWGAANKNSVVIDLDEGNGPHRIPKSLHVYDSRSVGGVLRS